ncbi:hypothetical protein [uncultured Thiodictyon sp.]|uniref:hypothetical protein n=1 Tax=uncultured Thiodictyon sp. TaxID=1846217 RepID=UPI0025E60489|nr:hypothetical protein [uncultured Thiodictyon sp.]
MLTPTLIEAERLAGDGEVKVKFSRHAQRRAKLYNIPQAVVEKMVADANVPDGEHEIISEVLGFKYPLKIVASRAGEVITVITNYPLKKGL